MEKSLTIPMSRRSFMKLLGMAPTAVMLGKVADGSKAEAAAGRRTAADFGKADLPVLFDTEVCVVGGGSAGTAAAISAARKGARVVPRRTRITAAVPDSTHRNI